MYVFICDIYIYIYIYMLEIQYVITHTHTHIYIYTHSIFNYKVICLNACGWSVRLKNIANIDETITI
jgi:hypothetical protein